MVQYNDNTDICKEVDTAMGGQVLETYADQKLKQGIQQGVMLMAQLSVKLAEDGRISEITRAASDTCYMDKLLEEYKINKDII